MTAPLPEACAVCCSVPLTSVAGDARGCSARLRGQSGQNGHMGPGAKAGGAYGINRRSSWVGRQGVEP